MTLPNASFLLFIILYIHSYINYKNILKNRLLKIEDYHSHSSSRSTYRARFGLPSSSREYIQIFEYFVGAGGIPLLFIYMECKM